MFPEDKVFQIALSVSLIAHGAILFKHSSLNIPSKDKTMQKIEVVYVKPKEKRLEEKKVIHSKQEPFLKIPSKITADKRIPPPFMDKENISRNKRDSALSMPNFSKPVLMKPDVIAIKKKITLPPIDLDKINNPSYISYYQIVREKIRRSAYQNYARTETGEVYLAFIVSSSGYLKGVHFIPEKSTANLYLKEIALRSIRDASPFPDFPKELDYPQLSFNVIISFEIE